MAEMAEGPVPHRRSIYWKVEREESTSRVLVYTFDGLVRLNPTASIIWGLMDGHHGVEEILQALREHYPLAPGAQLEEDVETFLRSAEAHGLILSHWSPLQPYRVLAEELVL
jgi:hypothetical protein